MTAESTLEDPEAPAPAERLRFETFLSSLAARLLNAAPEEVDDVIGRSLVELALFTGADRGGIGQFSEDGRSLRFSHPFARPGFETRLFGGDLAAAHPWYAAELRAGRPVIIPRVPEGLPEEARAEWAYAAAVSLKSHRSVLASVTSEIVVLDRDGRIVAVNEAWTRSARREALPQARLSVGSDYLAAAEKVQANGQVEGRHAFDGLRERRS